MKKISKIFMCLALALVFVVPFAFTGCDLVDSEEKTIKLKEGAYNVVTCGPDSDWIGLTYYSYGKCVSDLLPYAPFANLVVKENNKVDVTMVQSDYQEFNDVPYEVEGRSITVEIGGEEFNVQIIDEETLYTNFDGIIYIYKYADNVQIEDGKYEYQEDTYFVIKDGQVSFKTDGIDVFVNKQFKTIGNVIVVEYEEYTWAIKFKIESSTNVRVNLNMIVRYYHDSYSHTQEYTDYEKTYTKVTEE